MSIDFVVPSGAIGHCCGHYGEGSGAIHITCSDSERNITSCTYVNNDTVITSHAQDVGVECQQGQCFTLDSMKKKIGIILNIRDIKLQMENFLFSTVEHPYNRHHWGKPVCPL